MTNNTLRHWTLDIGRWTIIILLFPCILFSQTTSQTSFGKNRVQYNRQIDEWMVYESANFVTYWYGDARNIAQSALQMAEYDFAAVQQSLEHQMTDKIEMLVFSDLTDLKQSNIGEDEVFQLRAGETKVVGNKVFVYFDGDHTHLRAQIREGVAGGLINSMLFGSNLQEIVQNAMLLNLPGWYTNGLSAYCGEDWSAELDNQFRDLIQSGKYKNFDKIAKDHPRIAGHAFWNYISLHFGRGTVSNLLYLTRINRSMDAGFLYVLGSNYRSTTGAMMDYFKKRYNEEDKFIKTPDSFAEIVVKNKKKLPLSQLRISPDGRRVAWVSNDLGKWRVWVKDLDPPAGEKSSKPILVLKGGARNALQTTDHNYPQIAWNPDNQRLAVLYERRDIPRFAFLDLSGKKIKKEIADLSPEFQRVFSMDYVNPIDIAFSGAVRGYSDLFIYHTVTKQTERLTQDFWDDLDASVTTLDGRKGLLFSSNRMADTLVTEKLDTTLPIGRFDVFFFDLESRDPELIRITQTPMFDERNPIGVDSAHFAFLSDESGIFNRQVGYLEPYVAYNQAVIYLKDGAEVKALNDKEPGEWPLERVLVFLAPVDTLLKNIDSTQIDSIRFSPVFKKRARTWNQTNYDRNIAEQHVSFRTGRLVESVPRDGKTIFYTKKTSPQTATPARITRYREQTYRRAGLPVPPQPTIDDSSQSLEKQPAEHDALLRRDSLIQISPGWYFQIPEHLAAAPPPAPQKEQEPPHPTAPPVAEENVAPADSIPPPRRPMKPSKPLADTGKKPPVIRFNPSQIIPYRLKFRTDYVSTSLDNNQLFEGLYAYNGVPQELTPPVGILLRANFKDLMENYVVEAGFRLPTTFNGAEYYLWFDDKKHRWDKRYALYRKTVVNTADLPTSVPIQVRTNTTLGQYELRYPLDMFFSLRGTGTLRQDKTIYLSTNGATLEQPNYSEQRASVRLSAVYDNTVDVDLNLKTGSRAKFFIEAVKRFDMNFQPKWSLSLNEGFMTVIGLDARHYQLLDRRSILALRFAASTSFGSEKILYTLGGVDNWIFSEYNLNIPQPQDDGFAYQTLATNLRGFKLNIRNGNSYALLNSELRVPIFKYFSTKPVMGNFWRNFQLVGFFDVGTAWQGKNPYDGDNPINVVYLYNPPTVAVKVNYFRDPLVAGYGFGARALIFGMYLRADYAWGIETREVQKPIFYFAMGVDF